MMHLTFFILHEGAQIAMIYGITGRKLTKKYDFNYGR